MGILIQTAIFHVDHLPMGKISLLFRSPVLARRLTARGVQTTVSTVRVAKKYLFSIELIASAAGVKNPRPNGFVTTPALIGDKQNVLRACLAGCKDRWQGEGRWMNSLRRGLVNPVYRQL